jgi:riboflavin synthase alpha subunit
VVNLENDIVGKYVQKLLGAAAPGKSGGLTLEYLAEQGF